MRIGLLAAMLLALAGCTYRPAADLSPPPTAPEKAADNGYYQWAVVAEVKDVSDAPSPGFCLSFLCNEEYLKASLNVSKILGNAKNPVPTKILFGNEFGDDPFYHAPGVHYLMFIHSNHGVPTLGVYLPLLPTADGQLAVPADWLIPYWKKANCEPYLQDMDFGGPLDLRTDNASQGGNYWTEGYGKTMLQFGVIRNGLFYYTKGVLLKDMQAKAAKLFIGCG